MKLLWAQAPLIINAILLLAALATLRVSWVSGRIQNRAWISVEPLGIGIDETDNSVANFTIELVNSGPSPANITHIQVESGFSPDPEGKLDGFQGVDIQKKKRIRFSIGAKASNFYSVSFNASDALKECLAGNTYISFRGIIYYECIYRKKRKTYFFFYAKGNLERADSFVKASDLNKII